MAHHYGAKMSWLYTLISHNVIRKMKSSLVSPTSGLLSMARGRSIQNQFRHVCTVAGHPKRTAVLARGYPRGPMPSPIVVVNILHTRCFPSYTQQVQHVFQTVTIWSYIYANVTLCYRSYRSQLAGCLRPCSWHVIVSFESKVRVTIRNSPDELE